jgi:hypothetical protein
MKYFKEGTTYEILRTSALNLLDSESRKLHFCLYKMYKIVVGLHVT